MKKLSKEKLFWSLIIAVALIDSFSTSLAWIPVAGDIFTNISNFVYELIELGLVYGLIKSKK